MSGFDFGPLRDPDAPDPGSRHRDGVEARALELRGRARRNRAIVGGLAFVVVIAAVAGIIATRPDSEPSLTVTQPSSTTAPAPASSVGDFVPPTTIEHGLVVLPVTLPDGNSFALRYPPAMRLAQLGFAGGVGVDWPLTAGATRCCGKQISISYTTIARVYGDAKPIHVYRGAHGEPVDYFHASQAVPPQPNPIDYLVFQFGPWLVQVYDVQHEQPYEDRMTDAQRATWARSLTGTVDANGYLLLHANAPLNLSHDFDGLFGQGIAGANQFEIAEQQCGSSVPDPSVRARFKSPPGVAWCESGLHFRATGSPSFVDLVDTKLQVGTAPKPITTTTTTPATSSTALSASFVSAKHGWALEENGRIVETTDAGITWQTVGSVDHNSNTKIRFANATTGFAIPLHTSDLEPPLITRDGGHTWSPIKIPFGDVYDFAIARGVVYAVSFDQQRAKFRISSSPVDDLSWTIDPLAISPGAGPIPTIQLVFAGTGGWLIENDRVVTAGAKMSAAGGWAAWTPPCVGTGGPAQLAASTASDLVALCDEGVWTGGPTTIGIYFSHDGGATFTRHDAPIDGGVTSPDPHTAVLNIANSLQRSTDEGTTWHDVYAAHDGPGEARELGFTTSTQGYAILQDGRMLMTYDAGATWSAVSLP